MAGLLSSMLKRDSGDSGSKQDNSNTAQLNNESNSGPLKNVGNKLKNVFKDMGPSHGFNKDSTNVGDPGTFKKGGKVTMEGKRCNNYMSDSPRCAPMDRSSRLKSAGSMGKVSRKFPQAKPTGPSFKAGAKKVMSKR